MFKPSITLEVLPAGYGDCLLVTCPTATGSWRMLVDTGPDETYPALRKRLLQIAPDDHGLRRIDLFVVTHIDHDHIGGASVLLNDTSLGLSFGDIWFNAPPHPAARGVAEGQGLAEILGAAPRRLPWNVAWSGKPIATPAEGGGVELTAKGLPTVTLLSPTPQRLAELFQVWAKELERLRRKERDAPDVEPPLARAAETTLEELAQRPTALDGSVPNGSSIALLLEHRGASVLLAADAFAPVLTPAIRALTERRGLPGPLLVDVLKLSHHGSRGNVTCELLDVIRARHYVVSTNNTHFNHPNDEAIARIVVKGNRPTLWFNYDTPKNRRWAEGSLRERYDYQTRYPKLLGEGVELVLDAEEEPQGVASA